MGRKGLFAAAILIIAVGFIALGSFTSTDDRTAVESTTTTSSTTTTIGEILPPVDMENFTIDQLQTGEQFEWERVEIDETGFPMALLAHDGVVYLFATSVPDWRWEPGGLTVWRSTNGTTWESLGTVIGDEYLVSRITSTPHGLVAVGAPATGGSMVVWTSSNGRDWEATELPVETEHPHMRPFPMVIGANDEALVVAARVDIDVSALLEDHLAEAGYDIELDVLGWGTRYRGEEGQAIAIDAPLGIPGIEIGVEELGLTEQEQRWLVEHTGEPVIDMWTNPTGSDQWVAVEIEDADWVESLVTRADGSLLLTLSSMGRSLRLESNDGIDWTETDAEDVPQFISPWAGGFVGTDYGPRPEVSFSDDGVTWEESGLTDRFPPQIQWSIGPLATGEAGIAASLTGYGTSTPAGAREPVEITTDEGHILTLDLDEGIIELEVGEESHSWEVYRADPPTDGVDADIVERTVTFSDPDTGETLTELAFSELVRAEQAFHMVRSDVEEHHAFVFTGNGTEWTIQSASDAFGERSWVRDFEVGSGRVFAITFDPGEAYLPFATPEFALWVAEIP